jgi:ribosomal protein S12 methylthiotransferase accessory factor
MELAERYSFFSFSRTPEKFVVDTYRNLKDRALPFDMIAKSVHDDSDDLDQARRIFESLRMKWTWAYNLTRREPVLLPFDWFYAINEFNGPSAGNCTEEALSQGICEIVERHVSSIVSREKRILPAIDPDSADDALALEMLAKYRSAGIRLFVTDFTLDMGIPTVGVLAYDPSTFPRKSEIVWTAGTTPAPQKALSRALTEVAQLAGDFNSGSNYVASGLPKLGSLEEAEFITGFQSRVRITDLPDISDDNIRVEVENLTAQLASRGFEVLTIDTTHPQLAIPAYYTIIPGAHFRERALGTSVGMFATKLTTQTLPPGEAIERLAEIEKLLPGKYYVSFYLGSCHLASGNPREGLHHFETALERQPNPEDVASIYSYMGICFKELGDYRQALAVLEKGTVCDD